MTRARHSYITFYMDDWTAATAHLPRTYESVLFQVCRYNWDKVEPVPHGRLKIMVADLPDGQEIVNALVEAGSLEVSPEGVFSPRAMREAERALELWQKKSRGGRIRQTGEGGDNSGRDSTSATGVLQDSSKTAGAEPDPEPEPDSKKKKDSDSGLIEGQSVGPADMETVVDSWNTMARRHGLKGVDKMTGERIGKLVARLEEHGTDALVTAINLIPLYPFLLGAGEKGWKATLDWFLKPDSLVNVIEGAYEPRPGRKVTQDFKAAGPSSEREAEQWNAKLEEIGSGMRWQQDGKGWSLRHGTKGSI